MPNYCNNVLMITGPKEARARFVEFAKGNNFDWDEPETGNARPNTPEEQLIAKLSDDRDMFTDFCFQNFVPIPDKIRKGTYDKVGYNWSSSNWGTKWQVNEISYTHTSRSDRYMFDTAWAPPVPVFQAASRLFPELKFRVDYDEPGMEMQGSFYIINGQEVEE